MAEVAKRAKALVTGGANGLGRAFVQQLVRQGYQVHVADQDRAGLQRLHEEIGGDVVTHLVNLSDTLGLKKQITMLARWGLFDMVILNAGTSATGRFEKIPMEAHADVIAVNLLAPMLIANGLAAQGAMKTGSHMVFISSLSHAVGYPGAASYAASKDAIAAYAKSVRNPFAKLGITVTCAFPGPVRTGHAQRFAPSGANPQRRMAPEKMAAYILGAAYANKKTCYPGMAAKIGWFFGWIAPDRMTGRMRRIIFERLDGEVF